MQGSFLSKLTFVLFCTVLIASVFALMAFAVDIDIDEDKLNYYHVISKREWELASGIVESEIVMNTVDGNKRQVSHVVEIDINNPYTKVIPSTYKMADGLQNKEYSTQIMSEQAKYAEEHGYGNVIAAMNTALHWYDTDYYKQHPELIGEPLGTLILDGERYTNSQSSYFGAYTCLVINFDEKDGVSRPESIPKTQIRQTYDPITGWEEQLIPVNFHFLVKNGVSEHVINDTTEPAPRSFIGIKADGTIVLVMNEGRQAPFSTGFNCYEMAEFMISLGCVHAINCDGGGSSVFLSERPGEDLQLHCSPSDGSERPTTHGILVISTAIDTHKHIHSEATDKKPTDKEPGYVGRIFCTVCGIVLDEGMEIPATYHTYSIDWNNKKVLCSCGCTFDKTGFQIIDGEHYYTINGNLTSGWIGIDNEWYYFDTKTFSSVATYNNGYVTFKFYEDGKLVSGEWHKSSAGIRYYEGPSYIGGGQTVMTWYTIDGKGYCIDKQGYVATGTRWVNDQNGSETYTWHHFDENGVHLGKWEYTGLAEWNGNYYYVKDGISQSGMYMVDGNYYYFYWTNYYAAIKSQRFSCNYSSFNHGLLSPGSYYFGPDGKMLDDIVYSLDGTLYYFVKGNETKGIGTIEINGFDWKIEDNGKVLFTGFTKDYDGVIHYYENGVQIGNHKWNEDEITVPATCTEYGIVKYTCSDCGESKTDKIPMLDHVDDNKNFKCDVCDKNFPHENEWINIELITPATCTKDGVKKFTCVCGEVVTETIIALGKHIDENGDLDCDLCGEAISVKNGVVFDSDGNIRYYVDGKATRAGLVQDSQGNYYYINSSLKAVKNCSYGIGSSMTNGLLPSGTYQFDATGKMIDPPTSEGTHSMLGEGVAPPPATCTEDGVKTYICDCGLSKTEVIEKLGHIDEINDYRCDRCGAVIEHEHVWDEGVITTPATCTKEGVKTYTCKCGETNTETVEKIAHADNTADFKCDTCGIVVEHEHVWDDGVNTTPATCTKEGVKTYTCKCGETNTETVEKIAHADNTADFKCDTCGIVVEHEHVWDDGVNTKPATCTKEGVKTYTCKCGETNTETVEKIAHADNTADFKCDTCGIVVEHEHVWDDGVNTKPATCTKEGVKTYTCKCGETKTETVEKIAHADNTADFKCDTCGVVVEHEHVWDEGVITTPATCTKEGVKTYTCKCEGSKTEAIVARGSHIDENGDLTCDMCSDKLSAKTGLVFDSDGNIRYYVDGIAVQSKGLVQDSNGNYYYINSSSKAVKNCTYSFSTSKSNGLLPSGTYQFDATGKMIDPPTSEGTHKHVWGEGVAPPPATCTEDGVKTYICDCGLSKTEVIEKLGHIDEINDYRCDRCGAIIEHEHVWDEGVITTPATCTKEGVKTYTCKCGETKTGAIEALGHADENEDFACDGCGTAVEHIHAWDEGVITTPATCTKEGVKTYTCKCEGSKTEAIAARGSHIDENGDLTCDMCSDKLSAKTGLVFDSDGNIRYYVDGIAVQSKGLVQDSNGNYYYINSSSKAVKNCTYSFSTSKSNGLLPGGTYKFDTDGKMIID